VCPLLIHHDIESLARHKDTGRSEAAVTISPNQISSGFWSSQILHDAATIK
jgi:hypothetical protein